MIVPCRLKRADHRPIMLALAVEHCQPASPSVAPGLDENFVARLRYIDRYQHCVIRDRLSADGLPFIPPKVLRNSVGQPRHARMAERLVCA